MNCNSSRHACFYGGLVDTYKIPSIQNVVNSDKYQSTEENNCLKWKKECLSSLAHALKSNPSENRVVLCLKGRIP